MAVVRKALKHVYLHTYTPTNIPISVTPVEKSGEKKKTVPMPSWPGGGV
jgi:hypothetical protein